MITSRVKQSLKPEEAHPRDAARPFLEDKAAKVAVTRLDHITNHDTIQENRLKILRLSAFSLSDAFEDESIDVIDGLSDLDHIK